MELQARVQAAVADGTTPWYALPRWEQVSVGRDPSSGLHLPNSWVPRGLCRFTATDLGWLVQVGPRARMRVQDPWVGDHVFERRALVALQEGQALLSFPELDDWCRLGVHIGYDVADRLPEIADSPGPDGHAVGTAYAGGAVRIGDEHRKTLAVVFRHLLTGEPAPANLAKAAGERQGRSAQAVTNVLTEVRRRVNCERWGPKLKDSEQLGDYLVKLTRTISWQDLPPEHH